MRTLHVETTKSIESFYEGSGWEYEIREGRLIVSQRDGSRVVYAPGFWLRIGVEA